MTNILLAIDGPLYGKVIEDFVVNHNWAPGTRFKLVHFVEPIRGLDAWPEVRFDLEQSAKEVDVVAEIAANIEKSLKGMTVAYEVRDGYPKEEIVAEAISWPAQMIVMGSHGRQGLQRFLLGSVSMSTIMQAPCSVVVIRLPDNVQQESNQAIAAMLAKKQEAAFR